MIFLINIETWNKNSVSKYSTVLLKRGCYSAASAFELLTKYYSRDLIKMGEVGRATGMEVGEEKFIQRFSKKT